LCACVRDSRRKSFRILHIECGGSGAKSRRFCRFPSPSLPFLLLSPIYIWERGRTAVHIPYSPFASSAFFGRGQSCNRSEVGFERAGAIAYLVAAASRPPAMAERVTVLPPRDPWPFSSVSEEDLQELVDGGLLRPLIPEERPRWIVPGDELEPNPPAGYVVSFVSFHERGFGVPPSRFMRVLSYYYGVELHNFNPNSIAQAAVFAAVCEGYLRIDPHWDLWVHLFRAEPFANSTETRRVRTTVRAGGCTLQLRVDRAQQYIPASLTSSNKGWQSRWFYLRNDEGGLPPYTQRVVTAVGENWRWGAPRDYQAKLEPLLEALRKLWDRGLTAAGVVASFHRWRVLPLVERRLRLCKMTPEAELESSRMSSVTLTTDDLMRRVKGTVGRADLDVLAQPPMRPDHGYVSLVSLKKPASVRPYLFRVLP
jgi:hypothetical protein